MIYRVSVRSPMWGDQQYVIDADSQTAALMLAAGRARGEGFHDAVPVSADREDSTGNVIPEGRP